MRLVTNFSDSGFGVFSVYSITGLCIVGCSMDQDFIRMWKFCYLDEFYKSKHKKVYEVCRTGKNKWGCSIIL